MKKHDFRKGPIWDETLQCFRCDLRLPDGRRIKRRFSQQREAERWWNRIQTKIYEGTWNQMSQPKHIKFGQAADLYRESARVTNLSYNNYTRPALKLWERVLDKETPLAKVTTLAIEQACLKWMKEDGIKPKTANMRLGVLKRLFSWLEEMEIYFINPARRVKDFKMNNEERLVCLSKDQFDRLLKSCKNESWFLEPMVILAAGTGLRKANILKLKWAEVDFVTHTIRVTRTKTFRTYTIPMCDPVYETLNALHKSRTLRGNSDYAFPQTEGADVGQPYSSVYTPWRRALVNSGILEELRRQGITSFRWHDLRHMFASWLVMRGVDIAAVSKLLCHTKIAMTQRYVHLSPGFMKNSVDKLIDVLPRNFQKDISKQEASEASMVVEDGLPLQSRLFS